MFPGTTISTKTESNKQIFLTHSVVTPVYPGHAPWGPETFHAQFPVSVKSLWWPSWLRPTTQVIASEKNRLKNTYGTQSNPSETQLPKNCALEGCNRPFPSWKDKKKGEKGERLNLSSTVKESVIQCPGSGIHYVEFRIQDCKVMRITDMITQFEFAWYFINFFPLLL